MDNQRFNQIKNYVLDGKFPNIENEIFSKIQANELSSLCISNFKDSDKSLKDKASSFSKKIVIEKEIKNEVIKAPVAKENPKVPIQVKQKRKSL